MKSIIPALLDGDEIRPIPRYSLYSVTSSGAIVSRAKGKPKILRQHPGHMGHLRVRLFDGNGGSRMESVHRLVLEAFVGPCPDGMECRHLDSDPLNNHVGNLRWGTPKENADDRTSNGTQPVGANNPFSRISEHEALEIRCLASMGADMKEVADLFGVHKSTACKIARGVAWCHLPGAVNFRDTESSRYSKLDEYQVREIRRMHASGASLGVIASRFDISKPAACLIVNRKTWKNV